jgi:hypothetical protein
VELARYHATTFHFLETYGSKGADSFIEEYPSFALEGWMNESTEEGRKESELIFSPVIPVGLVFNHYFHLGSSVNDVTKLCPILYRPPFIIKLLWFEESFH